jgi:ceramide glucosyltransferase
LEERLVSVLSAKGLENVQLLVSLTTGRVGDPAASSCTRAAARLEEAGLRARAVFFDLEAGPQPPINQKVGQLASAIRGAQADIVINVDSDVDLDGYDFAPLIDPVRRSTTPSEAASGRPMAAMWAVPVERGGSTPADLDSASVLDASLHAFGLLGELDPKTFVGKAFALRADALRQVGGLDPLSDWLGEDMELARRLLSAGWGVGRVTTPVQARVSGRDARQVRARYARWMSVIRWQRPHLLASYPLLFFPAAALLVGWALLGLLTPAVAPLAFVMVLWVVSCRLALARGARRASGLPGRGSLAAGLRADWVLAQAWLDCLRSPEVNWRGRAFVKGPDGRMRLA